MEEQLAIEHSRKGKSNTALSNYDVQQDQKSTQIYIS